MEAAELLTQNVDKTQLPPLHQKRILAFVNHFLISSCSFLNDFALQCETKFIVLERKLQKVEAALTILEAKLASIPDVEDKEKKKSVPAPETATATATATSNEETQDESNTESVNQTSEIAQATVIPKGIRVTEHSVYKKFFKMLQVGVPLQAVKMKMQSEGVDPNILDNPHAIVPLEGEDES